MKRTRTLHLVLLGASAGALPACAPGVRTSPMLNPNAVLANDHRIQGVGYYHAPFRDFFPQPYNAYDTSRKQYYFGGRWGEQPHQSIVNVSAPTPQAIQRAETLLAQVRRGGFGAGGGSGFIYS